MARSPATGFAFVVALLSATEASAFTYTSRSGGRCVEYNGTICAAYGLGAVWLFDDLTLAEQEAELNQPFSLIDRGAAVVGSTKCILAWKELYCKAVLPPCTVVDGVDVPQLMCKDACTAVHERTMCGAGFTAVANVGFSENIIRCDDKVGDQTRSATYMYPNYLEGWLGKPQYPEGVSTIELEGNSYNVPCNSAADGQKLCPIRECPVPYVEMSRPLEVHWENETVHEICTRKENQTSIDCDLCESICEEPCHKPMWAEADWNGIWAARWFPGLVGMILNSIVVVNEGAKLRPKRSGGRKKATGNLYVFITAVLGLTYSIFDSLPSLILAQDSQCNGYPTHTKSPVINELGHPACFVLSKNVHVLQMMMAAVGVTLHQLYCKLDAAQKMRAFKQSMASQVLSVVYIFVIPLILMGTHIAQPVLNGLPNLFPGQNTTDGTLVTETILQDMTDANSLRYAFSCGPRFGNASTEWALILMPLVIYGAGLMAMSALLVGVVAKMVYKSSSAGGAKQKVKSSGGGNKTTLALARTMTKFAVACVFLVLLNLSTTVPFLSKALVFSKSIRDWSSCASSGAKLDDCIGDIGKCEIDLSMDNLTKTELRCGKYDAAAPAPGVLVLMNLAYSLPPLFFGMLFGYNILRAKLRAAKVAISSSAGKATSTAASSRATD